MSHSLKQMTDTTTRGAQTSLHKGTTLITAAVEKASGTPMVLITGDLHLCVSEAEVAARPVRGSYRIETEEMREPLQVIWSAEGRVLTGGAASTDIEFDLHGARAGQTWTYVVAVQVMGSDGLCCIVSGRFVQILVIEDDPTCKTERTKQCLSGRDMLTGVPRRADARMHRV